MELIKNSMTEQIIRKLILSKEDVFLTGGAGVGKTTTVNQILLDKRITAIRLASTGGAANLIGGMTIHRFYKLGICSNVKELKAWDKQAARNFARSAGMTEEKAYELIINGIAVNLRYRNLVIIDEVSMVSADMMEMLEYRYSQIGIRLPILYVGDFYQLPPVDKSSNKPLFAFQSPYWKVNLFELSVIRRTDNIEFAEVQAKVRLGIFDKQVSDYITYLQKNPYKENSLHLFATNKEIDQYNLKKLKEISQKGKRAEFIADDYKYKRADTLKFVNELLVNEIFYFKIGAKVLFVTNERDAEGNLLWYNGEIGTILDLVGSTLIIKKDNGVTVEVGRHTFQKQELKKGQMEVVCEVQQFPLRIAYAISIHKSQGLSLPSGHIECNKFFLPEQFFVGLSRFTDPTNLSLSNFKPELVKVSPVVQRFYDDNPSVFDPNLVFSEPEPLSISEQFKILSEDIEDYDF